MLEQKVPSMNERMRKAFQHYKDTYPDGPLIDPVRGTVSQRALHRAVADHTDGARGSSYGAVRSYIAGNVRSPRENILRAMAEVLRVRPEYLVTGESPVAPTDERIRKMEEEAAADH